MGISFTDKQQRVIDARGRNLLVSAAAGSGKTAVLVERIVKMVSDSEHPVDIDRLLVVTFTNAAASEMRERISRALNDRLALDPENEHLQRQTTLLHNARITTIDSFCLFVLRNQFHTIGLDPGFRIAEEGEGRLMRQDALAEVLEAQYAAGEPKFLKCMEYFSVGSRDTVVEEIVLKLYDFAMSAPFPEKWLAERKHDYDAAKMVTGNALPDGASLIAFEEIPWMKDMFRQTRLLLEGCVAKLSEAVHLCEEPDGPYMYGALLECEREMVEDILFRFQAVNEERDEAADGESDNGHEADGRSGKGHEADNKAWDGYRADRNQEEYDALCAAFASLHFDRLPSKKDETVSPVKREIAKNLRTEVKEQLADLQKKYFSKTKEQILQQMEVCGEAVEALVELTLAFKKAFEEKKRDKNILDFDDIEHFALSILVKEDGGRCVPTETALEYRNYFHEILIDEYQDSNLVQEYILSCISGEDEGRYNRFMVGDVKQSIYKFRLARPELFLEKYMAYSEQACGEQGANAEKIDLHQNFRSRREVVDSTNMIFEQIMGKDVGGIVYDDLAALYAGAVYPEFPMREKGVESDGQDESGGDFENVTDAQFVDHPNVTELLIYRTNGKPDDISAKEQEAYGVAMKIKELMRKFQVTDKDSGGFRQLHYRDIVILLRTTSGWDEIFKRVLEEEGIPVHMTSRTGYFAASEVQELLHFLRILDNPLQDIPLYGVMHAYLGGFDEEEIALIRASFPKKKYLYDALKEYMQSEIQNDVQADEERGGDCEGQEYEKEAVLSIWSEREKIVYKIRNFICRINRYRELATYLSVPELLQTILRETDYLNYVAVKPEGNKRRANVEMLLVKAADYEKTSYFGLNHFLRYMEQLEKYEVDYGEAGLQDENADVVRIMSIHKSKGLEFPVCFVSGLAKGFQTKDVNGHLVLDIDAGIGVDYVNLKMRVRGRDLRGNVIAEKLKVDNLAEEMRILYVAMTRAKEKLILTGAVKSADKLVASLLPIQHIEETLLPYNVLLSSGSFLDLLLYALARNHCMDEIYREYGLESVSRGDACIRVSLTGWEDTVADKLDETVRMEEAKYGLLMSDAMTDTDNTLMTHMSNRFAYQYSHENLSNLYTKTTVSELKMAGMQEETDFSFKLYEEETVVPYLPAFLEKDERVSGSMRGSAFHKVMELFDFSKLTYKVNSNREAALELLNDQLVRMRKDGRLSEEYYEVISVSKIVKFLMSKAAFRMGEAARAGKLYKEQPFVMGLPANRLNSDFPAEETVLIQGIIDVFFEEEGRYVLLDYKTDAVETAEQLVKRYHVQLDYYAEALEQSYGYQDTEKILYSFKLGEEIYL
ncbi:MAG: helicase-exonuclease AddAB subunit AddA [Eubacterium sp.]|nr:helicase-exonuclease AddAB subunit AddA [Eubacterium sp.]